MKKLLLLLLGTSSIFTQAQTVQDLFNQTPVYYLGIDFSHVQLMGNFSQAYGYGEQNSQTIRDNYFPAWNDVIIDERSKYDIAGMLRRDKIIYKPQMILEINMNADVEKLDVYNIEEYSDDQIVMITSKYKTMEESGIGIVFIAESLSKVDKKAVFHFVALNMTNGKILLQERLEGVPSGIGIRNYWAGSVYSIIQQIDKTEYAKWQKEYVK